MPPLITNTPFSGPAFLTEAWDPANSSVIFTLSGMQALVTGGGSSEELSAIGLIGVTSGKHYFEINFSSIAGGKACIGVASSTANPEIRPTGATKTGYFQYAERLGRIYFENTFKEDVGALMPNSGAFTWGVALDMDARTIRWFDQTGTEVGTGSPFGTLPATELKPFISLSDVGHSATANFGQGAFVHSVPSGYNPGWPGYF